jgi:hypothetical protein
MTKLANLNFKIARLRHQMRGVQSDIRQLTNAGIDCANAAARLGRMQGDLLTLIGERDRLTCAA